ncbi:NAD(P)/FAD-dependent oxidoreductase [Pseudomonas sp. LS44]|uniref:flavin-containing monooxygenase n=1 Tax=Pseudomonas sp. LS44 TaxID=1357074 RepID=UPI00215A42C4|nr:NAD(P)/FAD-dependent oxidoreductase [Pseudomonas sp. LS44]UVE16235.1 NAD(P)/FAD-dependent oxidoreductase [Pseudomonas sp. LS44]
MTTIPQPLAPLRVLIIGAGFAGLGLAILLQRAGIHNYLILEKADEVGGTWRDNSYPGAACDIHSHLYSFSFAPKNDWSRKFAPQSEILAYQRQLADEHGLRPHIRFGVEVVEAAFDEAAGVWQVTSDSGELFTAQALVSACGQLNRPAYPQLSGIEKFSGEVFHSARWNHAYDLSGKRVAVIGTGASAIQFVPQIASQVAQLHLFQRSAAYVIAKPDRPYKAWELAVMRRFPAVQKLDRLLKYIQHESRALAFSVFPSVMKVMRLEFQRHLRRGIGNPELRKKLDPDYPLGCKRILISNDYYPALARPNVEVISDPIREVTERGVITADGQEREVDAIIYGTGFAATGFLAPMRISGRAGQTLDEVWQAGAEAYLGISVSGFPNLFLLYGPNTNLGHNSILYMLESQFAYVLGCLRALDQGLRYLDLKPEVQQRFNHKLQHRIRHTVWAQGCTSWYQTADGKNTNNWPGFTLTYRHHTRHPEFVDYECIR